MIKEIDTLNTLSLSEAQSPILSEKNSLLVLVKRRLEKRVSPRQSRINLSLEKPKFSAHVDAGFVEEKRVEEILKEVEIEQIKSWEDKHSNRVKGEIKNPGEKDIKFLRSKLVENYTQDFIKSSLTKHPELELGKPDSLLPLIEKRTMERHLQIRSKFKTSSVASPTGNPVEKLKKFCQDPFAFYVYKNTQGFKKFRSRPFHMARSKPSPIRCEGEEQPIDMIKALGVNRERSLYDDSGSVSPEPPLRKHIIIKHKNSRYNINHKDAPAPPQIAKSSTISPRGNITISKIEDNCINFTGSKKELLNMSCMEAKPDLTLIPVGKSISIQTESGNPKRKHPSPFIPNFLPGFQGNISMFEQEHVELPAIPKKESPIPADLQYSKKLRREGKQRKHQKTISLTPLISPASTSSSFEKRTTFMNGVRRDISNRNSGSISPINVLNESVEEELETVREIPKKMVNLNQRYSRHERHKLLEENGRNPQYIYNSQAETEHHLPLHSTAKEITSLLQHTPSMSKISLKEKKMKRLAELNKFIRKCKSKNNEDMELMEENFNKASERHEILKGVENKVEETGYMEAEKGIQAFNDLMKNNNLLESFVHNEVQIEQLNSRNRFFFPQHRGIIKDSMSFKKKLIGKHKTYAK